MLWCRNSIFWCHHVRDNNSQRSGVFLTLIGIRELNHQYSTVISEKGLRNSVIGDFICAWVTIFLSFLTRFPNFITSLDGDVNANVCSCFSPQPNLYTQGLARTHSSSSLPGNKHAGHIHTRAHKHWSYKAYVKSSQWIIFTNKCSVCSISVYSLESYY